MPVAFLGHLSDDAYGRMLLETLESDGVNVDLVSIGHEPTTIARAEVGADGVARYKFETEGTSAPLVTGATLPSDIEAIHVGTLGLVLEPMASTLSALATQEGAGRVVMVDPNVRMGLIPDDEYRARLDAVIRRSTIVKASEDDLAFLYPGTEHEAAAEELLGLGVALVVVTLGASGAFAAHRDHRVTVPGVNVKVADTIGAGDAFGAALLAWLHDHDLMRPNPSLNEPQLREVVEFSNLAAAITCSREGADPPWRSELSVPRPTAP